jgi:AcrR family transcriptional regulator
MARQRSARAHADVLTAAMELIARRGVVATSMDAIAEASGVSKATMYRHWPDKDALCLEMLAQLHANDPAGRPAASGDVRDAIVALLDHRPAPQYSALRMRLMPHFVAYAASNPAFGKAWRSRVFDPPRRQLARLLERGVSDGLLPPTLDRDLAIVLLLGPMMYGHLLTRIGSEPPRNLAGRVVDAFWKAHTIRHGASGSAHEKVGPKRPIGDKTLPPPRRRSS